MNPTRDARGTALRELLSGELSAEQEQQLTEHLRDCPTCRRRLDELASQDTLLTDAARQLVADQTPPEEPLARAIHELRLTGRSKRARSPQRRTNTGNARASGSEIRLDFLTATDYPQALGRLGVYEILGVVAGRHGHRAQSDSIRP